MTVELSDTPSPGGSGKKGSPYLVHSADDTKQMQESEIGQDFIIGLVRHALDTDQQAPPERSQMKGVQHQPTKASRWSQRAPRTGTPVEVLLECRKKEQNLQNTGKITVNEYTTFQDHDNCALNSTAINCGINLGKNNSEVDSKISLLKAKELAQAAISKAADLLKQKTNVEVSSTNNSGVEVDLGLEGTNRMLVQDIEVELPQDEKSCENRVVTPSSSKGGHLQKSDT